MYKHASFNVVYVINKKGHRFTSICNLFHSFKESTYCKNAEALGLYVGLNAFVCLSIWFCQARGDCLYNPIQHHLLIIHFCFSFTIRFSRDLFIPIFLLFQFSYKKKLTYEGETPSCCQSLPLSCWKHCIKEVKIECTEKYPIRQINRESFSSEDGDIMEKINDLWKSLLDMMILHSKIFTEYDGPWIWW